MMGGYGESWGVTSSGYPDRDKNKNHVPEDPVFSIKNKKKSNTLSQVILLFIRPDIKKLSACTGSVAA